MKPGLHYDLDEQTYHGHQGSLSVSGAKVLLKAPALYRWQLANRVETATFDYGKAAHRLTLGAGAEIVPIAADDWRTKDAREKRDAAHAQGMVPLLNKDYDRVCAMADALTGHSLAMQLLAEGKPEVSAFAVDEATEVMQRARFDWLAPRLIVDYKSAVSVDPRDLAGRYGAVKKYGYDMQADWYLGVARALGEPIEEFAFIFQMKEPPYLVTVAVLRDPDLLDARARNREALERFRDCTESGLWPGFLPDNAYAALSLTDQTYTEEWISA